LKLLGENLPKFDQILNTMQKRIAIFASGSGTNAENLVHFFKKESDVIVPLILTNNPNAGVITRAKSLDVPVVVFDRKTLNDTPEIDTLLEDNEIDLVVLAGFLIKIPNRLIHKYRNRMVNIHPSLLPKYGGKGMYGSKVHEAVIANQEEESGITIHFVNEHYDEGAIIFQATCQIVANDNALELAKKIHQLEHEHFPLIVRKLIKNIEIDD